MANNHLRKNHKNGGAQLISIESSWSGPLPPPNTLAQFEEIHPGSAKIIMETFQAQTNHRLRLENTAITSNVSKEKRGQNYGLIIALVGILAGTACILMGHDVAGASIAGVDLVAIVTVFVIGKSKQNKDLQRKDNIKPSSGR